jgi:hypothetical protein
MAGLRVLAYLVCAASVAQVAVFIPNIRKSLYMTSAFLVLNCLASFMVFIHETGLRDLILDYTFTPWLVISSAIWMRTLWCIGHAKGGDCL